MFYRLSFGRSLAPRDASALRVSFKKIRAQRFCPGACAGPMINGGQKSKVFRAAAMNLAEWCTHQRLRSASVLLPNRNGAAVHLLTFCSLERSDNMTALSIRVAAASLFAIAVSGCTTTGIGTGQSANGGLGATFTWTETGGTRGTMVAQLSNGQVFQGPMFQITQESRVMDYGGLWNGWGVGFGWGRGWGGHRWGGGWGGWGP